MAKDIIQQDIPKIQALIRKALGEAEIIRISREGGLTNHTYHVWLKEGEYIVRIPGEGTEEMINRQDEKICTELACSLGIDARLFYYGEDGSKVTEFIEDAVTMSADSMKQTENIKDAARIYLKLHHCGVDTGVPFEVFDMAKSYEAIIEKHHVSMPGDYAGVKQRVMSIKEEIDSTCDTARVPCHNDPLCENWVRGKERLYLIDWEYAGMNDGLWDLADISIEAGYSREHDELLLTEYCGKAPDTKTWKHFWANKIYVDYLWTLWAKARVPFDGQPMEDWAVERYTQLKENITEFNRI